MKFKYSKLVKSLLTIMPLVIVASCNNVNKNKPKKPDIPPAIIGKKEDPEKEKTINSVVKTDDIKKNIDKPFEDKQAPKRQEDPSSKHNNVANNNSQNPANETDTILGTSPSNINHTDKNNENINKNNNVIENNDKPSKPGDENNNSDPEKDSGLDTLKEPDFSDLNTLNLNINLNIKKYQDYDALSYKTFIKDNSNSIISLLQVPGDIYQKYTIILESYELLNIDNEKGTIKDINLKFTLKNTDKFKVLKYSLSGFKTLSSPKNSNPKYDFITKQETKSYNNFLNLFPSLVGAFLLWNKNDQVQTNLKKNSLASTYAFESLANKKENEYFKDPNIVFNPSLPYLFLKINQKDQEKYNFKISGINANDIEGSLTLQIDIFDRSESVEQNKYPDVTKTISFDNFASFNKNINDYKFAINSEDFNINLKKYTKLAKKLNEDIFAKYANQEINGQTDITSEFSTFEQQTLKNALFNSLVFDMNNDIYQVSNINNLLKITDTFAFQGNYSIYPFLTKFNNDYLNISNVTLSLNEGKFIIKFNIEYSLLPFISSGFTNLDSFEFATEGITKSFTYQLIQE